MFLVFRFFWRLELVFFNEKKGAPQFSPSSHKKNEVEGENF